MWWRILCKWCSHVHLFKINSPKHSRLFYYMFPIVIIYTEYNLIFRSVEDYNSQGTFMFKPLTKESKLRRHIRSMSDVQSSTPYRIPFRSRKGLIHTLTYDSDTHTRMASRRFQDSSDSSDCCDSKTYIQRNILKHTERIL